MSSRCYLILGALFVVGCSSVTGEPPRRALVSAHWQWSDQRATAKWCMENQTGPRYEAAISGEVGAWILRQMPFNVSEKSGEPAPPAQTYESLFEGPLRISLHDEEGERFAWRGFESSVWHVVGPYLCYVYFYPGTPGGWLVLVRLDTGHVYWKVPMGYPLPQGWSMWMNKKNLEIRDDGIHLWSIDGGHFHEVFDFQSGRSLAWREYPEN